MEHWQDPRITERLNAAFTQDPNTGSYTINDDSHYMNNGQLVQRGSFGDQMIGRGFTQLRGDGHYYDPNTGYTPSYGMTRQAWDQGQQVRNRMMQQGQIYRRQPSGIGWGQTMDPRVGQDPGPPGTNPWDDWMSRYYRNPAPNQDGMNQLRQTLMGMYR